MEYGKFDNQEKEYVIYKYDTERPWINYLTNGSYCSLISQTGGGYSFWREPKFNRITKYRYDNHPQDRSGKYLYIKDLDTGEYWANGWQPVMKKPDEWECRHGLGYTKISSKYNNIKTTVSYVIPREDDVELWISKIKNTGTTSRKLKITPFVEFALFNAQDEIISYPNLRYFCDAEFSENDNAIIYFMHHHSWMGLGRVFMGLSEKITGYSVDRRYFFGNYKSEANPEVISSGKDHNTPVYGSDCVGAPSFEITLSAGEEKDFVIIMGVDNNDHAKVKKLITKYSDISVCETALKEVKNHWENLLQNFEISCPDTEINNMVNIWNQYQCKVTFDWSRWASYYHTGTYRGIGFRDTSQDSLGVLHILPEKVKEKIQLLAKNMYEDGHSYHSFFPAGGVGDERKYGDDHIWICNAVYHYINETGDLSILDLEVEYIEGSKGTILEHCKRAIEYALRETGHYDFPKMFFADWNDCLNNVCLKEKGEKGVSIMVAMQVYQFGKMLIEMANWAKKSDYVAEIDFQLEDLKTRINKVAWDGEWYIRAFTDEAKPIGSHKSEEGKIYLNAQSWAVLSGVADNQRGIQAMDSVNKKLNSEVGIKLLDPPYTKFPLDVGSVIHYPGGIKENAGIFCHANTWAIIAETKLRRADKAMQYYRQILPPVVAKKIGYDQYRVEPYVYCQFITGQDHPNHGSASHSWLTGTSVWNFVAISQYILGIRPIYEGLLIDPCIPADWDTYKVKRKFRGANYEIVIENPQNVSFGVKEIILNGKKLQSNIIPAQKSGSDNKVQVILGEKKILKTAEITNVEELLTV